jgi:Arc/MetJ family transcription regulator
MENMIICWNRLTIIRVLKNKVAFSILMCIYPLNNTHQGESMRTNIMIDDALMAQALRVSGFKTKKETVEEALKLLIKIKKQSQIRDFRGELNWDGNLEEMRSDA